MRSISTLSARAEQAIFESVLRGRISRYRDNQVIYSQGKTASTLFYIREGQVMLTVKSKSRRPAVITVLGAGDFFGQSCLARAPRRICTANAIGLCSILAIKKKEMLRILSGDRVTSNCFVSYLLSVINKYQAHMANLLANPADQRLARVLLRLAQLTSKDGRIPKISQTVLANMIGTTRSRTNILMNRFRQQGLIDFNGGIKVHGSLGSKYLRD